MRVIPHSLSKRDKVVEESTPESDVIFRVETDVLELASKSVYLVKEPARSGACALQPEKDCRARQQRLSVAKKKYGKN